MVRSSPIAWDVSGKAICNCSGSSRATEQVPDDRRSLLDGRGECQIAEAVSSGEERHHRSGHTVLEGPRSDGCMEVSERRLEAQIVPVRNANRLARRSRGGCLLTPNCTRLRPGAALRLMLICSMKKVAQ